MNFPTGAILAAAACGVAYGMSRLLCRPGSRWYVLDHPNERSLHDRPVPRNGGLAILAAFAAAWAGGRLCAPADPAMHWVWGGILLLGAVSYWDDRRGLSPAVRLAAQALAAGLLAPAGLAVTRLAAPGIGIGPIELGWVGVPATMLFAMWLVNLYNFMDGMDGFAAGMGVFGFGFLAGLAAWAGHGPLAFTAAVAAAANLGFLAMNFPPARLFMGDVGSTTMGYLAAALALWGRRDGAFPLWVPVLVFSPFVVDATVTLFARLSRREKVWQPHRTHYYQRLVRLGWGHRKTVLAEYALMAAAGLSAVGLTLAPAGPWRMAGLGLWALAYAALAWAVHRLESAARARMPPG